MHDLVRLFCVCPDSLSHHVRCGPLVSIAVSIDLASPACSTASFFGVGPAAVCSDPESFVRRSIVASVAYHGVRGARRELGVPTPAANFRAAFEAVQVLAREVALRVFWPCFEHTGQRGRASLRPRATPTAVGLRPASASARRATCDRAAHSACVQLAANAVATSCMLASGLPSMC